MRAIIGLRAALCALGLLASACVPIPFRDQVWKDVPATAEGQTAAAPAARLVIGDTVRVRTRQGKIHLFRVYKIEDEAFYGIARNKKTYRVGYGALTSMEVLRAESTVEWVPVGFGLHGLGNISPAVGAGALHALSLALLLIMALWRRIAMPHSASGGRRACAGPCDRAPLGHGSR